MALSPGREKNFISFHSPRMGRDWIAAGPCLRSIISIHSPRMGRDGETANATPNTMKFQSTLPAWGETAYVRAADMISPFQSTLPAWGETHLYGQGIRTNEFQSTLPAWGETVALVFLLAHIAISIHSPRMGRDSRGGEDMMEELISIHSPRMGRDPFPSGCSGCPDYFNPLSPHGERHSGRERSRP